MSEGEEWLQLEGHTDTVSYFRLKSKHRFVCQGFRGRPLIIWGGAWCKTEKKSVRRVAEKKFRPRGLRKKKLRSVNLTLKNFFWLPVKPCFKKKFLRSIWEKKKFAPRPPDDKWSTPHGKYDRDIILFVDWKIINVEIFQIFDLSWSPDGKQCATVCKDGKIRIYDPRKSVTPVAVSHAEIYFSLLIICLTLCPSVLKRSFYLKATAF